MSVVFVHKHADETRTLWRAVHPQSIRILSYQITPVTERIEAVNERTVRHMDDAFKDMCDGIDNFNFQLWEPMGYLSVKVSASFLRQPQMYRQGKLVPPLGPPSYTLVRHYNGSSPPATDHPPSAAEPSLPV